MKTTMITPQTRMPLLFLYSAFCLKTSVSKYHCLAPEQLASEFNTVQLHSKLETPV